METNYLEHQALTCAYTFRQVAVNIRKHFFHCLDLLQNAKIGIFSFTDDVGDIIITSFTGTFK